MKRIEAELKFASIVVTDAFYLGFAMIIFGAIAYAIVMATIHATALVAGIVFGAIASLTARRWFPPIAATVRQIFRTMSIIHHLS